MRPVRRAILLRPLSLLVARVRNLSSVSGKMSYCIESKAVVVVLVSWRVAQTGISGGVNGISRFGMPQHS